MFSDVRRRIAEHVAAEGRRPEFLDAIETWFSRPSFAALFLLCCALLGLFGAEIRVNRVEHEQSARLAREYLELIDPLLMVTNEPLSRR